jgi:hypothetical protein
MVKCEFLNEVLIYHDFGLELVKNGCLKSFNFKDENSSKQGLKTSTILELENIFEKRFFDRECDIPAFVN